MFEGPEIENRNKGFRSNTDESGKVVVSNNVPVVAVKPLGQSISRSATI